MPKIQVTFSSRPKLVSEIIRNLIEQQPDMEVMGEVIDPIELIFVLRETPVDIVIITPLKSNGDPRICRQLLREHPLLKIVTISAEGEAAFLYESNAPKIRIDNPTGQTVLAAIRESLRRNSR